MLVSGTAGTGKSYIIHCLRLLLQDQLSVAAPTGVAALFDGYTLHSLFSLPTKTDFKDFEGDHLHQLADSVHNQEHYNRCDVYGDTWSSGWANKIDFPSPGTGGMFLPAVWRLWPTSSCNGSSPLHYTLTFRAV